MTEKEMRQVVQKIRADIKDCVHRLDVVAVDFRQAEMHGAYSDMKEAAVRIEYISRTFLFHWGTDGWYSDNES